MKALILIIFCLSSSISACPKIDCITEFCPGGYVTDQNGCPTCKCCEELICPAVLCEYGYVKDANGCDTCVCNPPPCQPYKCTLLCKHGYELDDQGCEICKCKPAPICFPVACKLLCEHGYVKDKDGCEICKCFDPCLSVTCPTGFHCEISNSTEGYACVQNICNCSPIIGKTPICKRACNACMVGHKCCPDNFGCVSCQKCV